jgi:hypothetical protein
MADNCITNDNGSHNNCRLIADALPAVPKGGFVHRIRYCESRHLVGFRVELLSEEDINVSVDHVAQDEFISHRYHLTVLLVSQ